MIMKPSLIEGRWYRLNLNPFTDKIITKSSISGIYALYFNGRLQYIGESQNLAKRINTHLGNISRYFVSGNKKRMYVKIRPERDGDRKNVELRLIKKLQPIGNHNGGQFSEEYSLISLSECSQDNAYIRYVRTVVKKGLKTQHGLTDRAVQILQMRYGLGDYPKRYALQAVGDQLGLTRERIRQIEEGALEKLELAKKKRFDQVNSPERLTNFDLSRRCLNALQKGGIGTTTELVRFVEAHGFQRLYIIPTFGPKSMEEVKKFCGEVIND